MFNRSRSFKSVLNYPQRLFTIYQQEINRQYHLLRHIKSVLPSVLAEHVFHCVANSKGKILIYTDSSVWSSQLRFYQNTILDKLHRQGHDRYQALAIKVIHNHKTKTRHFRAILPSDENIELIRRQGLQQADSELGCALIRLGETLHRLSTKD